MQLQITEIKGNHLYDILEILGELEIESEIEELLVSNIDDDVNQRIVELSDHKKKEPTKKEKDILMLDKLEFDRNQAKKKAVIASKVITKVIRNAPRLKNKINPFLANLTSKEVTIINELSFKEYIGLIKQFIEVAKDDLQDFFSSMPS